VGPQRPDDHVDDHRIPLTEHRRRALGGLCRHLHFDIVEQAVKRALYHGPQRWALGRLQVERVHLLIERGQQDLHPAVRVQQPVLHVADLGKLGAQVAAPLQALHRSPRQIGGRRQQHDARGDTQIDSHVRTDSIARRLRETLF
jgi:hypothetical protein